MFTGFVICLNYSAVIVATGQTDSQEPQSIQVSLITRMRHLHKKIEFANFMIII